MKKQIKSVIFALIVLTSPLCATPCQLLQVVLTQIHAQDYMIESNKDAFLENLTTISQSLPKLKSYTTSVTTALTTQYSTSLPQAIENLELEIEKIIRETTTINTEVNRSLSPTPRDDEDPYEFRAQRVRDLNGYPCTSTYLAAGTITAAGAVALIMLLKRR